MKPILARLATEKSGTVESPGLFLMPKLRFSLSGTDVEVSIASTGIAGKLTRYTYSVFSGLDSNNIKFRILPRSIQKIGDKWIIKKKPLSTGIDKFDKRLAIYTNNDISLKSVLSERIQADLLSWAEQKTVNSISDIRNYDDELIFAVTGKLKQYEEYKFFLHTTCRFYDAVASVVLNLRKASNDWLGMARF